MKKPQKKWSDIEKEELNTMWPNASKDDLLYYFGRPYTAIKSMANLLKIKRSQNKYKLSKLNKKTNNAFYWLGFLMADGHFSDRNELKFTLKDKTILEDFVKFLGVDINIRSFYEYFVVTVADAKNISEIKNKFDIKQNKTNFPCDISDIVDSKYFYYWFSGFFDGDGTICSRTVNGSINGLRIQVHGSWLENFMQIKNRLNKDGITSKVEIDNQGYARLTIFSLSNIKLLLSKIKKGYKLKIETA